MGANKQGPKPTGTHRDNIFGHVPSLFEVQKAMSALRSFMDGSTSSPSKSSEISEMSNHDTNIMQSSGFKRVQNAYRWMKSEPLVQKMVASISSDIAVWDAILSNKTVQDLPGSLSTARENGHNGHQLPRENGDFLNLIMKWILGIALSKLGEVVTKIGLLVSQMFKPGEAGTPTIVKLPEAFQENVRSSLLLSVVVLLIVVVSRVTGIDVNMAQ